MFEKNYYCLVAGLREYALDSDTKGFNAREIIAEILEASESNETTIITGDGIPVSRYVSFISYSKEKER